MNEEILEEEEPSAAASAVTFWENLATNDHTHGQAANLNTSFASTVDFEEIHGRGIDRTQTEIELGEYDADAPAAVSRKEATDPKTLRSIKANLRTAYGSYCYLSSLMMLIQKKRDDKMIKGIEKVEVFPNEMDEIKDHTHDQGSISLPQNNQLENEDKANLPDESVIMSDDDDDDDEQHMLLNCENTVTLRRLDFLELSNTLLLGRIDDYDKHTTCWGQQLTNLRSLLKDNNTTLDSDLQTSVDQDHQIQCNVNLNTLTHCQEDPATTPVDSTIVSQTSWTTDMVAQQFAFLTQEIQNFHSHHQRDCHHRKEALIDLTHQLAHYKSQQNCWLTRGLEYQAELSNLRKELSIKTTLCLTAQSQYEAMQSQWEALQTPHHTAVSVLAREELTHERSSSSSSPIPSVNETYDVQENTHLSNKVTALNKALAEAESRASQSLDRLETLTRVAADTTDRMRGEHLKALATIQRTAREKISTLEAAHEARLHDCETSQEVVLAQTTCRVEQQHARLVTQLQDEKHVLALQLSDCQHGLLEKTHSFSALQLKLVAMTECCQELKDSLDTQTIDFEHQRMARQDVISSLQETIDAYETRLSASSSSSAFHARAHHNTHHMCNPGEDMSFSQPQQHLLNEALDLSPEETMITSTSNKSRDENEMVVELKRRVTVALADAAHAWKQMEALVGYEPRRAKIGYLQTLKSEVEMVKKRNLVLETRLLKHVATAQHLPRTSVRSVVEKENVVSGAQRHPRHHHVQYHQPLRVPNQTNHGLSQSEDLDTPRSFTSTPIKSVAPKKVYHQSSIRENT